MGRGAGACVRVEGMHRDLSAHLCLNFCLLVGVALCVNHSYGVLDARNTIIVGSWAEGVAARGCVRALCAQRWQCSVRSCCALHVPLAPDHGEPRASNPMLGVVVVGVVWDGWSPPPLLSILLVG